MELMDIFDFPYDARFLYQMLDRMRTDCEYYLGNGGRHPKYLWAGEEKRHIEIMKTIWESFPADGKPEWLSFEQILDYEKQMVPEKAPLQSQIKNAATQAAEQKMPDNTLCKQQEPSL